jgi:hypothetical protein
MHGGVMLNVLVRCMVAWWWETLRERESGCCERESVNVT